jgi:ssDNA-specific exonuclease RecJ
MKDIKAIYKDKTAKVIPNAITIVLNDNDKYFFTSFGSRDKTYTTLFKLWQTAIVDQVKRI